MSPESAGLAAIFSALVAIVSMLIAVWKSVPAIQGRQLKAQGEQIKTLITEQEELRRELHETTVWQEYRVGLLTYTVATAGIDIPKMLSKEEYWNARK